MRLIRKRGWQTPVIVIPGGSGSVWKLTETLSRLSTMQNLMNGTDFPKQTGENSPVSVCFWNALISVWLAVLFGVFDLFQVSGQFCVWTLTEWAALLWHNKNFNGFCQFRIYFFPVFHHCASDLWLLTPVSCLPLPSPGHCPEVGHQLSLSLCSLS